MATEIALERYGDSALMPVSVVDAELIRELRYGTSYKARITQMRNGQFHKLYFAMLKIAYDNQDMFTSQDDFLFYVKIGVGHTDRFFVDGQLYERPKSISFAKCDEIAFRAFFNKTVQFLLDRVLTNWTNPDVHRACIEISRF